MLPKFIAALSLALLGLVVPSPATAAAQRAAERVLTVSPVPCDSGNGSACSTELSVTIDLYGDDITAIGQLFNVDTREVIVGATEVSLPDAGTFTTSPLPPGRYEYRVTVSDFEASYTFRWRFTYSVDEIATVPPYLSAQTMVKGGSIYQRPKGVRILRGQVFARYERPDFTLAPWRAERGRTVLAQVKVRGKWRTVGRETTARSGGFRIAAKSPGRGKYFWRLTVLKTSKAPAETLTTARPL